MKGGVFHKRPPEAALAQAPTTRTSAAVTA
jgi:hypothetical protein